MSRQTTLLTTSKVCEALFGNFSSVLVDVQNVTCGSPVCWTEALFCFCPRFLVRVVHIELCTKMCYTEWMLLFISSAETRLQKQQTYDHVEIEC